MLIRQVRELERQAQSIELGNLQNLLLKLETLELQMVELGMIKDGDDRSEVIGIIKEDIYNKIQDNRKDTGAGFQGNVGGDGLSGFRG